jgi:hypothetical protein
LAAASGVGILGADARFQVDATGQFGALPGKVHGPQLIAGTIHRIPLAGGEPELDFLAVEEEEHWWDWSAAGLVAQRTTNLYRFPLPLR